MKYCMYIISALCAVAAASNTRGARNLEKDLLASDADLLNITEAMSCPFGGGLVFFNIAISIIPTHDFTPCKSTQQADIGGMISEKLWEVGVQSVFENMTFVDGICTTPSTATSSLEPVRGRALQYPWGGFIWWGGGGCRGCPPDDGDDRRYLTTALSSITTNTTTNTTTTNSVPSVNDFDQASTTRITSVTSLDDGQASNTTFVTVNDGFRDVFEDNYTVIIEDHLKLKVEAELSVHPNTCVGVFPTVSATVTVVQFEQLDMSCDGEFNLS